MSSAQGGFLLVRAGGRRVGLELTHVLGVTQVGAVHPVPSREPAVRGVASVQGAMVAVVHLGALLEGRGYPPDPTDVGVMVSVEGCRLCLEVDDAELLVRDRGLAVQRGSTLPWAVGVARHDDGLIPLLDVEALGARLAEVSSQ